MKKYKDGRWAIIAKAQRAVASCENMTQFRIAHAYYYLALNTHKWTNDDSQEVYSQAILFCSKHRSRIEKEMKEEPVPDSAPLKGNEDAVIKTK